MNCKNDTSRNNKNKGTNPGYPLYIIFLDCKMCGLPEANVDGVLAAYGARLQEGVPALEQQHQRTHRDQEEVVQL
jgi:hypothetical protein